MTETQNIDTSANLDITVTAAAQQKIQDILIDEGDTTSMLRIFVQGGGCAGMSYGFTLDENTSEDDYICPAGEISVVVDYVSSQYLSGAVIDYKEDLTGSQFVIRNPNAETTCGCGSSFSPVTN